MFHCKLRSLFGRFTRVPICEERHSGGMQRCAAAAATAMQLPKVIHTTPSA